LPQPFTQQDSAYTQKGKLHGKDTSRVSNNIKHYEPLFNCSQTVRTVWLAASVTSHFDCAVGEHGMSIPLYYALHEIWHEIP